MFPFTNDQIERYSRNMVLKEVGLEGQRQLLQAKILVIGAGGLGSPVLMYLAAAGIGEIGIVDYDTVELSNLQRQVIHSTNNINKSKVLSAKEFMNSYEFLLNQENIEEILLKYDLIIDCVDNFPTRYLVNDTCLKLNKPLVEGGILGFTGMVITILPGKGPCYRCLHPNVDSSSIPTCKEAGVLGVTAGIIGCIQANAGLKLILGQGENLTGQVLLWDGLENSLEQFRLDKSPNCPVCASPKSVENKKIIH